LCYACHGLLTSNVGYGHDDSRRAISWKWRPSNRFLVPGESEDAILFLVGGLTVGVRHDAFLS